MGGIQSAADAVEFLLAGATAVAVGTANFYAPRTALEVIEGLEAYMKRHGIGDVRELIGRVEMPGAGRPAEAGAPDGSGGSG
jgi:dihydroorotate dehydrogenase (NAD+) catalytic subunit